MSCLGNKTSCLPMHWHKGVWRTDIKGITLNMNTYVNVVLAAALRLG